MRIEYWDYKIFIEKYNNMNIVKYHYNGNKIILKNIIEIIRLLED